MTESDTQDQTEQGRKAVRAHLLGRLDEAGLARPKGVSIEAHAAMLQRLVEHLDYMTPANLMTLAETVLDHAQAGAGGARGVCPSEVIIRNFAHGLQAPPFRRARIVSSWLASVEGPVAEAAGYLVELFRFLRKHGRPPMAMDLREMREAAAANNRQATIVRDRIARGAAQQADRDWLEAYMADEREARCIVDAGRVRRQEGRAA